MDKEQQIETYREFFQALTYATEFDNEEVELTITYKDGTTYTFNSKTGENTNKKLVINNIETNNLSLEF